MKQIPDFPNYSITQDGQVWSHRRNRFLKPVVNSSGYFYHNLRSGGKATNKYIHKLIAEAFIPNPEGKPCVNHIDGNKLNNNVSNLEWCTHAENHQHAARTGLKPRVAKLTPDDVLKIRRLLQDTDLSYRGIGEMFGVDRTTIYRIKTGRNWSHI